MTIVVGTLYTLYGRRAGAELYAERIIKGISAGGNSGTKLRVFCNKEAYDVLPDNIDKIYIPQLDNQFRKALWLEMESHHELAKLGIEVFWIPSGTNHFPGKWDVPTVVTFHDFGEYYVKNKYDFKRTVYRKWLCIPRSIKRATVFTAVSETTASDLRKLFNVDRPVHVIYSGPSPWETTPETADIDAALFGETGKTFKNIIFVPGRIDYYGKGLDILLKSFKKLSNELQTECPQLVLAGPAGEMHEGLMNEVARLHLNEKVTWLGRVSDACMSALYRKCLFVVLASRYEGFGFPVLEAMKFSVPLICSDAGSLPEVAGDAALIFKSGDEVALCCSMKRLIGDEDLRQTLVERGKCRLKQFDWNKTYLQMNQIFLNLRRAQ